MVRASTTAPPSFRRRLRRRVCRWHADDCCRAAFSCGCHYVSASVAGGWYAAGRRMQFSHCSPHCRRCRHFTTSHTPEDDEAVTTPGHERYRCQKPPMFSAPMALSLRPFNASNGHLSSFQPLLVIRMPRHATPYQKMPLLSLAACRPRLPLEMGLLAPVTTVSRYGRISCRRHVSRFEW